MDSLLKKYGYFPDPEGISRSIELLASNLENVVSEQVLKDCFSMMDLTTLKTEDTDASVKKLVEKVNDLRKSYPDYPLPASICVYPDFAGVVRENLGPDEVHVTAVAACFPSSQSFLEVKLKECEMAVEAGADEIDIVLSLRYFLAGNEAAASHEIRKVRECVDRAAAASGHKVTLKVILETGLLMTLENIAEASFLAMEAGADFIKTSTGKTNVSATPSAAFVMCSCIAEYYKATGRKVGFKPSGGISSALDAVSYYSIVSAVLGREWLDKSLFRFGVSRLANSIMSEIEQKTVSYF